ncbi:MAG: hypothetical protein ABEI99_11640 [Halobaculum sp.]
MGQFDRLDPGERAAIRVAVDRDTTLLTDDLAARNAATDRSLDVHGSVGVVALARERNRLDTDTASVLVRSLQRETSLFVTDPTRDRQTGYRQLTDRKNAESRPCVRATGPSLRLPATRGTGCGS